MNVGGDFLPVLPDGVFQQQAAQCPMGHLLVGLPKNVDKVTAELGMAVKLVEFLKQQKVKKRMEGVMVNLLNLELDGIVSGL